MARSVHRESDAVELAGAARQGGLTPIRTRGLARVRQHADLMIARLGQALVRARAAA